MAFQLDPIFHNQTMVKILLAQGHLLHAGKICQKLLAEDSDNEILKELYEKTKTNFMKNFAGNAAKSSVVEVLEEEEEDEVTEPGIRKERLEAEALKLEEEKAEALLSLSSTIKVEEILETPVVESVEDASHQAVEELLASISPEEKSEVLASQASNEEAKISPADKLFNLEYLLLKVQERRL